MSGNKQDYKYDLKGQLLAVVDASGKAVEQYEYDAAGNILSKDIGGKTTTYKYDKANQLVSSNNAVSRTDYEYDAAGRLTKEGDKSYAYGWLDKVMNVSENGKLAASYDYGVDGQIASRIDANGKSESFVWDGLALIKRDSTNFVNESAVTGGNPILAFGKDSSKVLFEDMLGSSVGSVEGGKFNAINRTAFGELESGDESIDFFTGKPQVKELGYAFLFRNYRADQGKWQTADPIGFPDGWNNLAYCNNWVTSSIDWMGGSVESEIQTKVTAKIQDALNSLKSTIQSYISGSIPSISADYDYSLNASVSVSINNISINYTTKKLWCNPNSFTTTISNQSMTASGTISSPRGRPDIYNIRDPQNDINISITITSLSLNNPFIPEFTVTVNEGSDMTVYTVNVASISFGISVSGSINLSGVHWVKE